MIPLAVRRFRMRLTGHVCSLFGHVWERYPQHGAGWRLRELVLAYCRRCSHTVRR